MRDLLGKGFVSLGEHELLIAREEGTPGSINKPGHVRSIKFRLLGRKQFA